MQSPPFFCHSTVWYYKSTSLHLADEGCAFIVPRGRCFHRDTEGVQNSVDNRRIYSNLMHMSKAGIYNQLVSEYGEQFSPEAAQYAIDNIKAEWNENALKTENEYQDLMNMSPKAIYDQLVSEYGEKFTQEEAQYGIDHMEK